MGDPGVKLKRKVQLRKKVEDPDEAVDNVAAGTGKTGNTPTPNGSKSNKWIWIILVIIAVCVLGYFLFPKSEDKTMQGTEEPGIETVIEPTESTDSLTNTDEGNEVFSSDKEDEAVMVADNQGIKEDRAPTTTVETPAPSTTSTSTSTSDANVSDNVEAEAMKVIRGDYGVGQERKDKLGTKYQTIQSRVNELKREGIF